MDDFKLLIDFHKNAGHLGPGSSEDTEKALSLTNLNCDEPLKIADIGCGTGAQTLTLAKKCHGHITAVDLFPEFLETLTKRSDIEGLSDKITTLSSPMEDLPFSQNEFDLLWSEGAVYIMGFNEGITAWKDYIKSGGFLVVSEISWITDTRPDELTEYWQSQYPGIDTVSAKTEQLEKAGYKPTAHFIMPEKSWNQNYYGPMEDRFESFLKSHNYSEEAVSLVDAEKAEIDWFKKYSRYYSYVFYIAQKL